MKKVLFSLWLVIGLATTVFSQAFEIEWSKNYGGSGMDSPDQIKRTEDGGFIIVGFTKSTDGDLSLYPYSSENATWLLKLDVNGNMEWSKVFNGDEYTNTMTSISSVYPTTDGGYILVQNINIDPFSNNTQIVYKLDESGEIVWQNLYSELASINSYIQQTIDNGFIVLLNDPNGFNNLILKLNESGETEWETEIGFASIFVKQISNENYILGGWDSSGNNRIGKINMLNPEGELLREILFQEEGFDTLIFDGIETADGNFLFVGYKGLRDGPDYSNYFAVKLNQLGETIWSNTYGGAWSEWAQKVLQTEDGGYIISGVSDSIDGDISQNLGLIDNWVVKINGDGNLLCQRSFGGSLVDGTFYLLRNPGIEYASNGGFVLATGSQSSDFDVPGNRGDYDFWIYKINMGNCEMSISETDTEELIIYPNPIKDVIYFSVFVKEITLYNLQGKLVKHQRVGANQLDVSALPKGNYILNLTTEKGQKVTHKIIKE